MKLLNLFLQENVNLLFYKFPDRLLSIHLSYAANVGRLIRQVGVGTHSALRVRIIQYLLLAQHVLEVEILDALSHHVSIVSVLFLLDWFIVDGVSEITPRVFLTVPASGVVLCLGDTWLVLGLVEGLRSL